MRKRKGANREMSLALLSNPFGITVIKELYSGICHYGEVVIVSNTND
jgi:hypothetical protein